MLAHAYRSATHAHCHLLLPLLASAAGLVDWEIAPMEVPGKGGAVVLVKEVRWLAVRAAGTVLLSEGV